ncbi:cytidyltransferase [Lutibacter sp. B2]|nr:cytidyltransferase [Lutibacter sp. B2]
MNHRLVQKLYNDILNTLLNDTWLNDKKIDKSIITNHVQDISFFLKLNNMITKKDYSCYATLELCKDMLTDLSKKNIPENWLEYIYQFALSKSFPHALNIKLIRELDHVCYLYLDILRIISEFQKIYDGTTFQSKYPLVFLTKEEEKFLENPGEYKLFLKAFKDEYIYEMMKLNYEIEGHNTLDHICGVHYLALHIARQFKLTNIPVDLGRVSGSTAGHDIGKFGCTKQEQKRVPYLHYYYTDLWFTKQNIEYIRNIALNHSVWDLELDNLSLESLILIYCDFRVKNNVGHDGNFGMHIYSLSESFDVILKKLDQLDANKQKRYTRVYNKLKDFENFMIHLGIQVESIFSNHLPNPKSKNHYSLLQGEDIVNNIKYLSINHNIQLMYQLRDEHSLNLILQLARSEKNWNNLREYLRIFNEYSIYLTQQQKIITLRFLYEQLTHPKDDIRKHCAKLIGTLIAMFDEDYRKEVPDNVHIYTPNIISVDLLQKYVQLFLYPDHKIIPKHREWIGELLSTMISSLFTHKKNKQKRFLFHPSTDYLFVLLKYFKKGHFTEDNTTLYLLKTLKYIPIDESSDRIKILHNFLIKMLQSEEISLRITALEIVYHRIPSFSKNGQFFSSIHDMFIKNIHSSAYPSENFLKLKIAKFLDLEEEITLQYINFFKQDQNKIPSIFLSNLKIATNKIIKKIQVSILLDYSLEDPKNRGFHASLHFCNLLKVSTYDTVRKQAGEAILDLVPYLSFEHRNEVAVELISALELNSYEFVDYIPSYLGELILALHPGELDELIEALSIKIKQSNKYLSSLLLKTIGVAITNYPKYEFLFNEDKNQYNQRLIKMLGILLNGLVHDSIRVKQVALGVIGKDIFSSTSLTLEEKNNIFQLLSKKMLTLLNDFRQEPLLFLSNSASLHHIYRFISEYTFLKGDYCLTIPKKIAFFPGTFDPFSLGHKEIAKSVRNLGFEVYLAIDEFSWSKQTLPHLLRKNIANMSIANELNIYLYPEHFPTNIANKETLKQLKDNFSYSEVHIVVGSDVVLNASSYTKEATENSIHSFPHIIFERNHLLPAEKRKSNFSTAIEKINEKVTVLALSSPYEDISSTQIRNYIDENRDISSLVDPLVQKYIYENGFYRSEPQYKSITEEMSIKIQIIENIDSEIIHEISSLFNMNHEILHTKLIEFSKKRSSRLLIIRDLEDNRKILGFSMHHWARLNTLYNDLKDNNISEYIRENAYGRIAIIDGIFANSSATFENLEQIILTETLSFCLSKDYEYAVFNNIIPDYSSLSLHEILRLQGFIQLSFSNPKNPVFTVNMSSPCTLLLDLDTFVKEPFKSNPQVHAAILQSRKNTQKALTNLYPGNLILSFDKQFLHATLIRKICAENKVPTIPLEPQKLGDSMCVPFGSILNRSVIPNTVTKSLHTEKLFLPHMKNFIIGPFPHYNSLEIQIKMIHAFNRPIILVDDILHKGYRNNVIHPLLQHAKANVKKTIVGLLSARGKELMDRQGREVDCAYYIPKLRSWFNESYLCPFFGGDTVWRGQTPQRNLVPSINLILPYTSPAFLKNTSNDAIYNFSKTCIENSINILSVIENIYHDIHERNLTLASLGEVFVSPRCPDHGKDMYYDLNLNPSHYLENDLELLNKLEHTLLNK